MNQLTGITFLIDTKVIRDTIEYIFIGKNKFFAKITLGLKNYVPCIHEETDVIVCEFNPENKEEEELLISRLEHLRVNLSTDTPIILFSETPEKFMHLLNSYDSNLSIVSQDQFFLDHLFDVLHEVLSLEKTDDMIIYNFL